MDGIIKEPKDNNEESIHHVATDRLQQIELMRKPRSEDFEKAISQVSTYHRDNPKISEIDSPTHDDSQFGITFSNMKNDSVIKFTRSEELFLWGMLAFQNEELDMAIELLTKSYQLDETLSPAAYFLYIIYDRKKDKKNTKLLTYALASNDPDFIPGKFLLGLLNQSEKKYEAAKFNYLSILRQTNELFLPKLFYADIISESNCELALNIYNEILKSKPDLRGAKIGKAYCLKKLGKKFESLSEEIESFSMKETYAESYLYNSPPGSNLGELSIPIPPMTWFIVVPEYTFFERSRMYFDNKDYYRSLVDINKAIEIDPDDIIFLQQRADIYDKLDLKIDGNTKSDLEIFGTKIDIEINICKALRDMREARSYTKDEMEKLNKALESCP